MAILNRKKKTDAVVEAATDVKEEKPKKTTVKKSTKTTKKSEATTAVATKKIVSRFAAETVLAPLVTEKAARLSGQDVMVFRIARTATRVAVSQAIKQLYGVTPVKVNVINVRGKVTRFGGRLGRTQDTKKALVTLPKGTRIDVFASV